MLIRITQPFETEGLFSLVLFETMHDIVPLHLFMSDTSLNEASTQLPKQTIDAGNEVSKSVDSYPRCNVAAWCDGMRHN